MQTLSPGAGHPALAPRPPGTAPYGYYCPSLTETQRTQKIAPKTKLTTGSEPKLLSVECARDDEEGGVREGGMLLYQLPGGHFEGQWLGEGKR